MPTRHELARRAALRVLTVARIRRRRNGHGPFAKVAVVALTLLFTMGLGGGAEAVDKYQAYTRDLPDTNSLRVRELAQSTKIYDRNGVLLYVKHTSEGIRTVVPLSAISPHLVQATISLEDRTFYSHHGIDFRRIVGAAIADITHVRAAQGGSTITQQLVKATLLTNERSVERKIKEAVLALDIERRYTKTQILTLYLNEIFYGHDAYGAEAAAQTYFAKSAKDLDVAEAAMLAGIPNAPSSFDPFSPETSEAAKDRQTIVLRAMLRDHHITPREYDAALAEKLVYKNGTIQQNVTAPWFVDYVLQLLDRQYGPEVVRAGGLQVTTTLDTQLQKVAEAAVTNNVNRPDLKAKNVNNGAAEVIDPATGQVLAMVGSASYYNRGIGGEFNVITSRPGRQPGSSFKIYVYSTAFSNGLSPANVSNDQEGKINGQPFVDWDHKSEGIITLRQALAESRNIPAILLLKQLGYSRVFQTARMMGLVSSNLTPERGLGQAIGASEVIPLEHFNAFAVLANGGVRHDPTVILKVTDSNGQTLQEWKPSPGVRVLSPQVAYLVNDVLKPVGASLRITRPFSSKTGTTENWHDSWFIGYNPDIVIGAWMGHTCAGVCPAGENSDLVTPAGVVWGAFGPGLIFRDIFNAYEAQKPVRDWTQPNGLKQMTVCKQSGLRASAACLAAGQTVTDWFIAGLAPVRDDDWYKQVRVCTTDGLLAGPETPAQITTTKTFVVYPPGYPDELKDKDNPPLPTQTCNVLTETIPPTLQPLLITQLPDGGVTITAQATDDEGIKEIDFFLDGGGSPIAILTQAPYSVTIHIPGPHTLIVQAYDFNPSNAPAVGQVTFTVVPTGH
jgi:membrane peptidoglycan carboxypeptidase